jgi:hypothetical protein
MEREHRLEIDPRRISEAYCYTERIRCVTKCHPPQVLSPLESLQEAEDDLYASQIDAHLFGEKADALEPPYFFR